MSEQQPIVLVVDDEDLIRDTMRDMFEDEDFSVFSVASAEEGLEFIETQHIDVCTVDMRLPGMTGNDFIMQANKKFPNMAFVIHTGSTNYSLPEELLRIGVTSKDVFLKPVEDMNLLVEAVLTVFKRKTN